MNIKRSQFSTTFVMIALYAITAAVQLLSAYGSVCVTWNYAMPYTMSFPYVGENLFLFKLSNIVAWLCAFFWGFVIYCTLTQKKMAYILALISSFLSFVFGLIPAMLADLSKVDAETAFSIGSPHWGKTMASALVLILLIIPPVRNSLQTFVSTENKMTGNISRQIMMMSLFFFWFSFVSLLGTNFMAGAHMVNGVNYWQLVEIQSIGTYVTAFAGISMLGGGFLVKQFKPSTTLITSMEENH